MATTLSVPAASEPAGTPIVALPPDNGTGSEPYLPIISHIDPVGAGLPLPPLTATVTINGCAVLMLDEEGVTVTVDG